MVTSKFLRTYDSKSKLRVRWKKYTKVKGANNLEDGLIQYHACYVRPQTLCWSMPKNEVASPFHLFDLDLVILQPSLRSEDVWVVPVDWVALRAPRVETN